MKVLSTRVKEMYIMSKRNKRQNRSVVIRLRIREVAEQKGVTRTQLSRRAEVNYATVQAVWNDPYHDLSIKLLEKISVALSCNIADLYETLPDNDSKA